MRAMLLDRIKDGGALPRLKSWRHAQFVSSDKRVASRLWYSIPRRLQTTLALVLTIILLLTAGWTISLWRAGVAARAREVHHESAEKHLVIASYTAQNVSWLSSIPSAWTIKRYIMDDPQPQPPLLSVPLNQGREAMAYLTYIIDHYDRLPEYIAFVHGDERSWHQQEHLQQKVRALNLTALDDENYISFRCGVQMGCERLPYIDTQHVNWSGEAGMCDFWRTITGSSCPRYVSYKCCAQHAVTRSAILKRSKAAWIRIRSPLMEPSSVPGKNWLSGMLYEKFWHMLFSMPPEHCPYAERCRQVHFSNAIVCDGDTDAPVFEGDAWRDVRCVSAFDGLDRDAPAGPALKNFSTTLLQTHAKLRKEAGKRHQEQLDAWHAQGYQQV